MSVLSSTETMTRVSFGRSAGPRDAQAVTVSSRIRQARERVGLSQFDLAMASRLRPETVSRYETGKNKPTVDALLSIAAALDVTTDFLLGHEAPAIDRDASHRPPPAFEAWAVTQGDVDARFEAAAPALAEAIAESGRELDLRGWSAIYLAWTSLPDPEAAELPESHMRDKRGAKKGKKK